MANTLFSVFLAVCLVVILYPADAPAVECWVAGPLTKVKPLDPVPETPVAVAELYAARNEFEPFQIVLRAQGKEASGIDIDVSALRTADGAEIAQNNITVYREEFLNLKSPSSLEGGAGMWPDPLIPRVDRYASEKRNAFPLHLDRASNQPVWIEIFIPDAALPGRYHGEAKILQHEKVIFTVPIHLTVWAFRLPSTASLRTSFGLNGTNLLKAHHGHYTGDADLYRLTRLYADAALEHRISIHGGSMIPPKYTYSGGNLKIDWTDYDNEVGPFLNGTAIPDGDPLHGARATSIELRTPSEFPDENQHRLYLREWVSHFRSKGWLDRLFLYLWDEPKKSDYQALVGKGKLVASAAKDIHTLVTTSYSPRIADVVDIWAPIVNCLEEKPGAGNFCQGAERPPSFYSDLPRGPARLWFYQSCASHGCNIVGGDYFDGWPSYMIDASGPANRVMQWIGWSMQVEGELYYSMDEAFGRSPGPWHDIRLFGGNGEGTLFYPGRPDRIGGSTDIPIESIRLKLIREGLEDYEYLDLLAKLKGRPAAQDYAGRIVKTAYSWERDPATFLDIRRELGNKLDSLVTQHPPDRSNVQ